GVRRKIERRRSQSAHFGEQVELKRLAASFGDRRQAVRAEADVHSCCDQFLARKRVVTEKRVAARTVNHADAAFAEQVGVGGGKIVHMHGEQIVTEIAV